MKLLLAMVYSRYSTKVDISNSKANLAHEYVPPDVWAHGNFQGLRLTMDPANGMSARSLGMFCRFMVLKGSSNLFLVYRVQPDSSPNRIELGGHRIHGRCDIYIR